MRRLGAIRRTSPNRVAAKAVIAPTNQARPIHFRHGPASVAAHVGEAATSRAINTLPSERDPPLSNDCKCEAHRQAVMHLASLAYQSSGRSLHHPLALLLCSAPRPDGRMAECHFELVGGGRPGPGPLSCMPAVNYSPAGAAMACPMQANNRRHCIAA
jgi:hypothetical protein